MCVCVGGTHFVYLHLKPVIVKPRDGGQETAPSTKTSCSKSCQVWATLEYTLDTVFILTPQSQSARRNLFEGDEPALLAQLVERQTYNWEVWGSTPCGVGLVEGRPSVYAVVGVSTHPPSSGTRAVVSP